MSGWMLQAIGAWALELGNQDARPVWLSVNKCRITIGKEWGGVHFRVVGACIWGGLGEGGRQAPK